MYFGNNLNAYNGETNLDDNCQVWKSGYFISLRFNKTRFWNNTLTKGV